MSDFRQILVNQIKGSGEYLATHAEEIVDKAGLKTGVSIWLRFEQDEIPTIEISQTHYMNEVLAYMRGDEEEWTNT